jgi:hypothetical protein
MLLVGFALKLVGSFAFLANCTLFLERKCPCEVERWLFLLVFVNCPVMGGSKRAAYATSNCLERCEYDECNDRFVNITTLSLQKSKWDCAQVLNPGDPKGYVARWGNGVSVTSHDVCAMWC